MVSPLKNNPLQSIGKFCNEFYDQDVSKRKEFLSKTYKNNQHFHKVWDDPYVLLKEFEEKKTNSKFQLYNVSGDLNISINQNNNMEYEKTDFLKFENYKNTYGLNRFSGYSLTNSKNPNFYICQEKFKRKIVYVNKKYLSKLIKNMKTAHDIFKIDVKNFKKACLLPSSMLFENNEIQIGCKTNVLGNAIKISLYISNKSAQIILNNFLFKMQSRNRNLRSTIFNL